MKMKKLGLGSFGRIFQGKYNEEKEIFIFKR